MERNVCQSKPEKLSRGLGAIATHLLNKEGQETAQNGLVFGVFVAKALQKAMGCAVDVTQQIGAGIAGHFQQVQDFRMRIQIAQKPLMMGIRFWTVAGAESRHIFQNAVMGGSKGVER